MGNNFRDQQKKMDYTVLEEKADRKEFLNACQRFRGKGFKNAYQLKFISGEGVSPPLRRDIVEDVAYFLESRGLEVEGIFRISGQKPSVLALWSLFGDPKLKLAHANVHVVASAFKLYLRQSPDPVIDT